MSIVQMKISSLLKTLETEIAILKSTDFDGKQRKRFYRDTHRLLNDFLSQDSLSITCQLHALTSVTVVYVITRIHDRSLNLSEAQEAFLHLLFMKLARTVLEPNFLDLEKNNFVKKLFVERLNETKRCLEDFRDHRLFEVVENLLTTEWSHPLLQKILLREYDLTKENELSDVVDYIENKEHRDVISLRVHILFESDCHEMANNLVSWCDASRLFDSDVYMTIVRLDFLHNHQRHDDFHQLCCRISCCFSREILKNVRHGTNGSASQSAVLNMSRTFLLLDWMKNNNDLLCTKELLANWLLLEYEDTGQDVEKSTEAFIKIISLANNVKQLILFVGLLQLQFEDKFIELISSVLSHMIIEQRCQHHCSRVYSSSDAESSSSDAKKCLVEILQILIHLYRNHSQMNQSCQLSIFYLIPSVPRYVSIEKFYSKLKCLSTVEPEAPSAVDFDIYRSLFTSVELLRSEDFRISISWFQLKDVLLQHLLFQVGVRYDPTENKFTKLDKKIVIDRMKSKKKILKIYKKMLDVNFNENMNSRKNENKKKKKNIYFTRYQQTIIKSSKMLRKMKKIELNNFDSSNDDERRVGKTAKRPIRCSVELTPPLKKQSTKKQISEKIVLKSVVKTSVCDLNDDRISCFVRIAKLGDVKTNDSRHTSVGGVKTNDSRHASVGGVKTNDSRQAAVGGVKMNNLRHTSVGGVKSNDSRYASVGGVKTNNSRHPPVGAAKSNGARKTLRVGGVKSRRKTMPVLVSQMRSMRLPSLLSYRPFPLLSLGAPPDLNVSPLVPSTAITYSLHPTTATVATTTCSTDSKTNHLSSTKSAAEVSAADQMSSKDELTAADQVSVKDELTAADQVSAKDELTAADQMLSEDELTAADQMSSKDELTAVDQMSSKDELTAVDQMSSKDELTAADQVSVKDELTAADKVSVSDELTEVSVGAKLTNANVRDKFRTTDEASAANEMSISKEISAANEALAADEVSKEADADRASSSANELAAGKQVSSCTDELSLLDELVSSEEMSPTHELSVLDVLASSDEMSPTHELSVFDVLGVSTGITNDLNCLSVDTKSNSENEISTKLTTSLLISNDSRSEEISNRKSDSNDSVLKASSNLSPPVAPPTQDVIVRVKSSSVSETQDDLIGIRRTTHVTRKQKLVLFFSSTPVTQTKDFIEIPSSPESPNQDVISVPASPAADTQDVISVPASPIADSIPASPDTDIEYVIEIPSSPESPVKDDTSIPSSAVTPTRDVNILSESDFVRFPISASPKSAIQRWNETTTPSDSLDISKSKSTTSITMSNNSVAVAASANSGTSSRLTNDVTEDDPRLNHVLEELSKLFKSVSENRTNKSTINSSTSRANVLANFDDKCRTTKAIPDDKCKIISTSEEKLFKTISALKDMCRNVRVTEGTTTISDKKFKTKDEKSFSSTSDEKSRRIIATSNDERFKASNNDKICRKSLVNLNDDVSLVLNSHGFKVNLNSCSDRLENKMADHVRQNGNIDTSDDDRCSNVNFESKNKYLNDFHQTLNSEKKISDSRLVSLSDISSAYSEETFLAWKETKLPEHPKDDLNSIAPSCRNSDDYVPSAMIISRDDFINVVPSNVLNLRHMCQGLEKNLVQTMTSEVLDVDEFKCPTHRHGDSERSSSSRRCSNSHPNKTRISDGDGQKCTLQPQSNHVTKQATRLLRDVNKSRDDDRKESTDDLTYQRRRRFLFYFDKCRDLSDDIERRCSSFEFRCNICGREFGSISGFRQHVVRIHNFDFVDKLDLSKGFKCRVCDNEKKILSECDCEIKRNRNKSSKNDHVK